MSSSASKAGASVVICFLLAASATASAANKEGGGAFAPAPSIKSQSVPMKKERTIAPSKPQAISGCVVVTANVSRTKSNGKPWDVDGKNIAPDLFLIDQETRKTERTCKDSFSCSWTLKGKSGRILIEILDRDVVAHDKVGSGSCSLSSSSCQLGRASLKLRGC